MFDKAKRYFEWLRKTREAAKRFARMGSPSSKMSGGFSCQDTGPYPTGVLIIHKVFPDGKKELVHQDNNLVVTQAEALMAQMSMGTPGSDITHIWLGKESPITPPALGQINLLDPVAGQFKATSNSAVGGVATYQATWGTGDGNGYTFTEAGLFTGTLGSGTMFARKTFPGITKNSSFSLVLSWLVTFKVPDASGSCCSGVALVGPSMISPFTIYNAVGGEASVACTFDFNVGSNLIDPYLRGVRMVPTVDYQEGAAPLNAPVGGNPLNKGINLLSGTLNPGDQVFIIMRALA